MANEEQLSEMLFETEQELYEVREELRQCKARPRVDVVDVMAKAFKNGFESGMATAGKLHRANGLDPAEISARLGHNLDAEYETEEE